MHARKLNANHNHPTNSAERHNTKKRTNANTRGKIYSGKVATTTTTTKTPSSTIYNLIQHHFRIFRQTHTHTRRARQTCNQARARANPLLQLHPQNNTHTHTHTVQKGRRTKKGWMRWATRSRYDHSSVAPLPSLTGSSLWAGLEESEREKERERECGWDVMMDGGGKKEWWEVILKLKLSAASTTKWWARRLVN